MAVSAARMGNTIHWAETSQRNYESALARVADAQAKRKAAMKRCIGDGMTHTATAEIFGVTRAYVSNVVAGRQGK
jgi:hypothetical protein